ncbi:phage upper tail fiber protein [Ligaoa zhengdingensis]|uniref:phage upper tail fiber protein n=1 Tax=Ligaoa zhengdingensis TaxID=2763658 RepID=UPI0031BBBB82
MARVTFQDEQGQNLARYKMTLVEGSTDTYDLTRMATITQHGTPFNKEVMDQMAQLADIEDMATVDSSGYVEKSATVKDQNSITPKMIWSGTKDQYNAVEIKDPATIYFVLEDSL